MTNLKKHIFLIFLILVVLGLSPSFLKSQRIKEISKKTLTRVDDPVVMEGKDFRPLLGQPPDKLSLMALKNGQWCPIPFQVDEKKPDGEYAFTHGPQASRDPEAGLDSNDELVFMAMDTGDRAGQASWPEGAVNSVEIEITDPKNGAKAWAYLFQFSENASRANIDYVHYELDESTKRRKVTTRQYIMASAVNRVAPDFIAWSGPDGAAGPDILDRLKIRGHFVLPMDVKVDYIFDEWAKSNVEAYIDGPVRVLEYGAGYLDVNGLVQLSGQGYSVISYYDKLMIYPTYIEVPFDLRGIVKEWPTYGYMDFNKNIYGTHAFSAANPYNPEVVFDGKMSAAEKNLNTTTEIDWVAGFGPQGAMVSRLPKPKEWKGVKILPYYLDDETAVDKPEDHPGVSGIGYKLLGMEKLGKYSTTFYQYYYFKQKLAPEDINQILDIMDHPLTVKTAVVAKPD